MPDEQVITQQIPMYTAESTAGQIVRLETKRRLIKQRYDQLKAKSDAMEKELAEYRNRQPDPTVEALRAELLEIKHRKIFDRLANDAGVNPGAVDNLWKTSGYKIDQNSDIIPEDSIKALIGEQKKAEPYLFKEAGSNGETEQEKSGPGTRDQAGSGQLPRGPGTRFWKVPGSTAGPRKRPRSAMDASESESLQRSRESRQRRMD